jgi:hypothetical protein
MTHLHVSARHAFCALTLLGAQQLLAQKTPRDSSVHGGASRFAFAKDASGCPTSHITNTRFVFLQDTGLTGKVLRETIQTDHCLTAEATNGEIRVTAWRTDRARFAPPIFSFHASAQEGGVEDEFYRTVERGCCGPGDLSRYFSLENGRELFASSGPVLRIKIAGGSQRIVTVHDTYSATLPTEAEKDSTVLAVFEYGDGLSPSHRWMLRTPGHSYFRLDSLYFIRRGKQMDSTSVWFTRPLSERTLPIVVTDIRVVVHLHNSDDSSEIRAEIPIENSGPQPSKAIMTPSLSITPSR